MQYTRDIFINDKISSHCHFDKLGKDLVKIKILFPFE